MNPESVCSESELERRLSEPYPETVALMKRLPGGLIVLGVGGKMGPRWPQPPRAPAGTRAKPTGSCARSWNTRTCGPAPRPAAISSG